MGMPNLPALPALPTALPGAGMSQVTGETAGEAVLDASGKPIDFAALLSQLGQGNTPDIKLDSAQPQAAALPLTQQAAEALTSSPGAAIAALEAALSASGSSLSSTYLAGNALQTSNTTTQSDEDPGTALSADPLSTSPAAEILALIGMPPPIPAQQQNTGTQQAPADLLTGINPDGKGQHAELASLQQLAGADGQPAESAKIAAEPAPSTANAPTFNQALQSATLQPTTTASAHTAHLPTHVHDHAWAQGFGERVTWLAKQDIQAAQITLNPPQLGPIQITLSLNGDQATANFGVANADVRQVVENSLPQLREMLASAGIQLGDANVGAQLPQQARDQAAQMAGSRRGTDENAILPAQGNTEAGVSARATRQGSGLVDLFA